MMVRMNVRVVKRTNVCKGGREARTFTGFTSLFSFGFPKFKAGRELDTGPDSRKPLTPKGIPQPKLFKIKLLKEKTLDWIRVE